MSPRVRADERRQAILRATLALVAEKGFAGVTLRDVAASVGVAHSLIRHYFGTRDGLVAAAFDSAVTAELAQDEEYAERAEPLEALADWLVNIPREHYLVWIDAWSEAPRNPALATALRRHHRDCERRLARIIERLAGDGLAHSDNPADDARALTALGDGVAVQVYVMRIVTRRAADAMVLGGAEHRLGIPAGTLTGTSRRATRERRVR
ncbi:MAG: TetR/AcrR family transcriptional regulator [Dermatophilaceae bacterium]